jgi:uncharacterized protein YggE
LEPDPGEAAGGESQVRRDVLWLAALALAGALPASAQQQPEQPPFLLVAGTGEARIASDRARLDFMVETQAPTAAAASAQNADRMQRVVTALRTAGGQTVTVETGGYELMPVYRQVPRDESGIPVIEAYRAVNHVRVRADDVTRVGALIDAGIGAGANRIAGLSFEARNPEPARADALRQAVAKARAEADAVASAMGVTLGAPLEVNVSSDYMYPPPRPMYREMAMDMAQAAPTPVEPGEQVVRATVTIRYRLATP